MSDIPAQPSAAPQSVVPSEQMSNENKENQENQVDAADVINASANPESAPKEEMQEGEKAIAAMKKKFKLKVDGEEIEEEVDLSNEEDLKKRLQLAKAAQKRMQENAHMKKAVQDFYDLLQNNPDEALSQLGFDPLKFSEERLRREIEEQKKSPQQKEFERQQMELEKHRKELEKLKKEREESELRALEERYHRQLEDEILGAIDGVKDVPRSAYFIKRVSDMMASFIRSGKTDVTAKDIVPIVRKQIKQELKDMYSSAPEDILEELWGKQNLDRLRKKRIAKVREAKKLQSVKDIKSTGTRPQEDKPRQKTSMNDFFRKLK